jgi:hypothetical protein
MQLYLHSPNTFVTTCVLNPARIHRNFVERTVTRPNVALKSPWELRRPPVTFWSSWVPGAGGRFLLDLEVYPVAVGLQNYVVCSAA